MTRKLVCLAALALLTAACESEPTGPQCNPITLSRSGTQGDTVVLNTGLRYVELTQGTGATAEFCDLVQVRYTGRFTNGTQFDAGNLPPITLGFQEVIPGFEQGIVGMRVGGTRRLIIPPQLGYGPQDVRDPRTQQVIIPANSTLIFDVELLAHADG